MIQRMLSKLWNALITLLKGKPSLESLQVGNILIIDNTECRVQGVWTFTDAEGYGWKEYVLIRRRTGELEQKISLEVERDDGMLIVNLWEEEFPLEELPFVATNPDKWPSNFQLASMNYIRLEKGQMIGTITGETPYSATYADYLGSNHQLFSIEISRGGEVEAWLGQERSPESIQIVE